MGANNPNGLVRTAALRLLSSACLTVLLACGAVAQPWDNTNGFNQTLDTSNGNACTDAGGILTGGNIFTALDGGTFGTGSGAADEFPATNPYASQIIGGTFNQNYSSYNHGDYSIVSNQVTRRNGGQFNGTQVDPVNGPTGRFFVSDPNDTSPTFGQVLTGLVPGRSYEASIWIADTERNQNGAKNRLAVVRDTNPPTDPLIAPNYDIASPIFLSPFINSFGGNNSNNPAVWQKYSFVYNHDTTNTSVALGFRPNETGAGGRDVFMDEVQIVECILPVDIVTTKTLTPGSDSVVPVGQNVSFDISVENNGPGLATGVSVTDVLPAGLTLVGTGTITGTTFSPGGTYTVATGLWDIGDIAAGETVTLTLVATVDPGQEDSTITNTIATAADGNEPDPTTVGDDLEEAITVPPLITADDDDFSSTPVDSSTGGTAGDVYDGDTLGGAAIDPADVTLTVLTPATSIGGGTVPELVLTGASEGEVTVPAGTPAGTYTIEYQICEDANPNNCADATITVVVVAPSLAITKTATPDSGYAFGDTITYTYEVENTGNVTINNVTVTDQHTSAAGTAALAVGGDTAGTDVAPLGDSSDDGNADNGVWGALAPGDTVTFTSEYVVKFTDFLAGIDLENTATVTGTPVSGVLEDVTATEVVSLASIGSPRPALIPGACGEFVSEGFTTVGSPGNETTVTFGSGTAFDPYTYLQIGENADGSIDFYYPAVTQPLSGSDITSATVGELETSPHTAAGHESEVWRIAMRFDGQPGSSLTVPLRTENVWEFTYVWVTDTSGNVVFNTPNWLLTNPANPNASFNLNFPAAGDGILYLNVAVFDPVFFQGDYTVAASDYTCPPVIVADDDDFTSTPVDPDAGGAAGNIFTNDGFDNGDPIVPAETTITVVDNDGLTGVSIATDGTLTVPPNTPPGLYEVEYQICETGVVPVNCDTAIAEVLVLSIDAVDDPTASVTGGGTLPSVLSNDSFNGSIPADLADVSLTPGTAPTPAAGSITMNADGTITVSSDATPGTYTYDYEICSIDYPTICDTATANILVEVLEIDAIDDAFPIANGADGGTTPSVLANDSYAGIIPAALPDVTLTPGAAPTPPAGSITMNPDGTITVDPNTTAGTYTYPYEICETGAVPDNCDTAIVTIVVDPPEITADSDDFSSAPVNGADGGTAGDAYDGDTLNGAAVDAADITPTVLTPAVPINGGPVPELVLSGPNEGEVSVPPGTPSGTYTITYRICEDFNPTNCANAEITVVVDPPAIFADDDDFSSTPINGADGGTVGSVYDGDTLNSDPVDAADITPTVLTPATPIDGGPVPELVLSGPNEGDVTVPAGTPAGTYTIEYQICEDLNPANCSQATITVVVEPPLIEAIPDDFSSTPFNSLTGGATPSVLVNDELNDVILDPADVVLTPGVAPTPTSGSITMNPDGTITVAPGTTAGTYSYPYEICEVLNPLNCSSTTATIVVDPPEGTELIDDISVGNIPGTAVTVQVMNNDPDGSNTLDPSTLTIVGTSGPGQPLVVPGEGTWTVDLASGSITFTPEPGFTGNPTPIEYVVTDIFGNILAPATVTILYEAGAAFVCSDVIGKVFDDKNHDGRQDPGERGIAAARLATVNGFIITTDEYGRFSIPCAALPSDIGSTFLLKLDPRSLPTGYRLTTENPKTVRLTPGTMRRMNFGATISNLVRVDLTSDAFLVKTKGGRQVVELSKDLDDGLKVLVRSVAKKPSTIRLSYYPNGEDSKIAKRRLKLVEDRLKELWRGRGRYQLSLEKTIVVRK